MYVQLILSINYTNYSPFNQPPTVWKTPTHTRSLAAVNKRIGAASRLLIHLHSPPIALNSSPSASGQVKLRDGLQALIARCAHCCQCPAIVRQLHTLELQFSLMVCLYNWAFCIRHFPSQICQLRLASYVNVCIFFIFGTWQYHDMLAATFVVGEQCRVMCCLSNFIASHNVTNTSPEQTDKQQLSMYITRIYQCLWQSQCHFCILVLLLQTNCRFQPV